MNIAKTCLFGGTLVSAGLVSAANAQAFNFLNSDSAYGFAESAAIVVAYSGDDFAYKDTAVPAPNIDLSVSVDGSGGALTATTTRSNTSITSETTWDGNGPAGEAYAIALLTQVFSVSEDAQIIFSWDFAPLANEAQFLALSLRGLTFGNLLSIPNDAVSGSAVVDVFAGEEYIFIGDLAGFTNTAGRSFVNAQLVPTPGAAAIIGFAGLAASRRRR